jgi:hypothetical protein
LHESGDVFLICTVRLVEVAAEVFHAARWRIRPFAGAGPIGECLFKPKKAGEENPSLAFCR